MIDHPAHDRAAVIAKTYSFEAAHHLPFHQGACRRPHGHSYRVEVAVRGVVKPLAMHSLPPVPGSIAHTFDPLAPYRMVLYKDGEQNILESDRDQEPDVGMVMDFSDLSAIVKPIIEDYLDHQSLNDTLKSVYPTAENIAYWLTRMISANLPESVEFHHLTLWETATSSVTVTRADL